MAATEPLPDLSLIVCTRDRPVALGHCLASIRAAAATAPQIRIELIVVDNSPTRSAEAVVATMGDNAGLTTRLVHEPVRGLARARNTGLREARAAILAFTDDDCRLDPDYFASLARAFAQHPDPTVMGGAVALGDPHDVRYTVREGDQYEHFHRRIVAGGFIIGCNFTLNRSAYEKIGLFDTRFGAGGMFRSAEDTDYVVRAFEAGVPVIFSPEFAVSHHHGRSTLASADAVRLDYNFGNGALLAKHLRTSPWLGRQFGWLVRECVKEVFTGRPFDPVLGHSHFSVLTRMLAGMMHYVTHRHRDITP